MIDPNFFVLGAQKAGTTWLAAHLAKHPDVFFTDPKEPLFFSHKRAVTAEDYTAYRSEFFGLAGNRPWRGEGSTTYLQWPAALDQIQAFVPGQPRFIVCLRQPLTKAISFFIHNWRRDYYPAQARLTHGMDRISISPFTTSLYADSIERWLAAYPRKNFLFLRYDDLEADPAAFLGAAMDFLGIRRPRLCDLRRGWAFLGAATDFLGIMPRAMHLRQKLNVGLPLVWKDGVLTTEVPAGPKGCPQFTMEELACVQKMLLPDIRRTAALTGLDLSDWLDFPTELISP